MQRRLKQSGHVAQKEGPAPLLGRNLTSSIVAHLGRAIVTDEFSSTCPFLPNEKELCARYDVSRAVLREALKMLTSKGLLQARPRQGTRVQPKERWNLLDPEVLHWLTLRKLSVELVVDLINVRLAIEPRAAALAAASATPAQQAEIKAAVERMEAAERGEEDPLDAGLAFHVAVLKASNNQFFAQFVGVTEASLRLGIRRMRAYKSVPSPSVWNYHKLADRILSGDAAAASRDMYALIEGALKLLLSTDRRTSPTRQAGS